MSGLYRAADARALGPSSSVAPMLSVMTCWLFVAVFPMSLAGGHGLECVIPGLPSATHWLALVAFCLAVDVVRRGSEPFD